MHFERFLISTIYWRNDRQYSKHALMSLSSRLNYLVIINSETTVSRWSYSFERRAFALKIIFHSEVDFLFLINVSNDRFERSSSFHVDVVNSLLLIEESLIARTRDRFQDAKNIREKENAIQERNENREMINKRIREFEASIHRESSNFEKMKAEMTILHNEDVASKIQNVLHRADSAFGRERERERERERGRKRRREGRRRRDREQAASK